MSTLTTRDLTTSGPGSSAAQFASCTAPSVHCTNPYSTPLGGGAHTFTMRATKPAGNTDPTRATTSFRICSGVLGDIGLLLDGLLLNCGLLCS
jgi:hypothetical protein